MPAAIRRSTAVAVWSEIRPTQLFEPAVVCLPSTCSRSLSAIGSPASGPRDDPGPALEVGGIGCGQRVVAVDIDERVQLAIEAIDSREAGLDDFARARLAFDEQVREFGQ